MKCRKMMYQRNIWTKISDCLMTQPGHRNDVGSWFELRYAWRKCNLQPHVQSLNSAMFPTPWPRHKCFPGLICESSEGRLLFCWGEAALAKTTTLKLVNRLLSAYGRRSARERRA